jgi:ribosomal protein S15P/S13E
MRVRWNLNTDTPLPPDVPAGENPPDGAVIDYFLGSATAGVVTLEIRDQADHLVRRYSSTDPVPATDPMLAIPAYWLRPAQVLSNQPGMHRFLWDLHYQPVPGVRPAYPIAAVYEDTAPEPTSPWVQPGRYTLVLSANGVTYRQALNVGMDPRVKTSSNELLEQFRLSRRLYEQWLGLAAATDRISAVRSELSDRREKAKDPELRTQIDSLIEKLQSLSGGVEGRRPDPASRLSLASATNRVRTLFNILQEADVAPTPQAIAAIADVAKDIKTLTERWQAIRDGEITAANQQLKAAGLGPIDAH